MLYRKVESLVGVSANPPCGEAQGYTWQIFPENCMK